MIAECLYSTLTLNPDMPLLELSYPNEQDAAFVAPAPLLSTVCLEEVSCRAVEVRRDKGSCWWNPDPER